MHQLTHYDIKALLEVCVPLRMPRASAYFFLLQSIRYVVDMEVAAVIWILTSNMPKAGLRIYSYCPVLTVPLLSGPYAGVSVDAKLSSLFRAPMWGSSSHSMAACLDLEIVQIPVCSPTHLFILIPPPPPSLAPRRATQPLRPLLHSRYPNADIPDTANPSI